MSRTALMWFLEKARRFLSAPRVIQQFSVQLLRRCSAHGHEQSGSRLLGQSMTRVCGQNLERLFGQSVLRLSLSCLMSSLAFSGITWAQGAAPHSIPVQTPPSSSSPNPSSSNSVPVTTPLALSAPEGAVSGVVSPSEPPSTTGSGLAQWAWFQSRVPRLQGRFSQVTESTQGRVSSLQSGSFAIDRPGRLRWEIETPAPLLLVSDGERLVQYDADLEQAIVRPLQQALSQSPAAVLFGQDLSETFALQLLEVPNTELAWLRATPLDSSAGFTRVDIGWQDGFPVTIDLLDGFGQLTRIRLESLTQPEAFAPGTFEFVAPPGTVVVEGG